MDLCIEIPESISIKGAIIVSSLRGYKCKEANNAFGVEMYSGGFCQSFPLVRGNEKRCLRLWIDDDARSKDLNHIKNVSSYFSNHNLDYVINYTYENSALRLGDNTVIPGVVMDWVDGETLIDYVKQRRYNSSLIKNLADSFYAMVKYLSERGMAHGDLSGKNIIVKPSGELVMIDYDTFYISGQTERIKPSTGGVACYQHPERKQIKYISSDMDNYSQLVIYLSLLVIAKEPDLINQNADEGLLFQDEDMRSKESLVSSKMYQKVSGIRDDEIQMYLNELVTAISGPITQVRSIVDIKNSSPQEYVVEIKAPYCGKCGHGFGKNNSMDDYCPMCGTKRETL